MRAENLAWTWPYLRRLMKWFNSQIPSIQVGFRIVRHQIQELIANYESQITGFGCQPQILVENTENSIGLMGLQSAWAPHGGTQKVTTPTIMLKEKTPAFWFWLTKRNWRTTLVTTPAICPYVSFSHHFQTVLEVHKFLHEPLNFYF